MTSIAPVVKEVSVNASVEHAFKVFTDGIDRWWPRQHHIGQSPLKTEVLETRMGGRWYGLSEDGTECDIGKVLVWQPPTRLVLSWQLTAEWQFDPDFLTEIEVVFTAEGPGKTKVVLEHRNLDAYGSAAPAMRKMIGADDGWGLIVDSFVAAANM
jgi:uncharacterized protein YndB with AHSA1/START domain